MEQLEQFVLWSLLQERETKQQTLPLMYSVILYLWVRIVNVNVGLHSASYLLLGQRTANNGMSVSSFLVPSFLVLNRLLTSIAVTRILVNKVGMHPLTTTTQDDVRGRWKVLRLPSEYLWVILNRKKRNSFR